MKVYSETPDRWVILKISDGVYKVLAGWYGGYLHGDSWRLNSGIVKVEEDGDYYLFHGKSGSTYKCHKDAKGFTGYTSQVLENLITKSEGVAVIEVVGVEDIDISTEK